MQLNISEHLGLEHPEDMPLEILIRELFCCGYRLQPDGNGNLESVPICPHRSYSKRDGLWQCDHCGERQDLND